MAQRPTLAQTVGCYVSRTDCDVIPPLVREKARLCVLDSLGCAISGSTLAPGRQVVHLVHSWGGVSQSTVAGLSYRLPAPWTAYVNGYLANLLDFDDTTPFGHPGSTIVPDALAVGEWRGCSGRELVAAVVAGYDVSLRIADAIRPSPAREPYVREMGTWQIFGAVAATARLLGLDADRTAHALALAVNHAPVPSVKKFGYHERPISWIKSNLGWASAGGILAAQLAANGMDANLTNFDGPNGFWIMAGADENRPEDYTRDLEEGFRILDVGFKPYPACLGPATTLDAIAALMQQHHFAACRVHRVVVAGAHKLLDFFDPAPRTIPDAQFSIPYLSSVLLLGHHPGYAWFSEANLNSPEVAALATRFEFVHDDEAEARYRELQIVARVQIELDDGCVFEESADTPRGSPARPLPPTEVSAKFLNLASPVVGASHAERLLELVEDLEQIESVACLADLYGGPGETE